MKNILFVDDDEQFLDGLKVLLHRRRREWDMHFAANAREALDIMSSQEFDIVVADMRMPGMSGADLLSEVQRLQPGAVRIILSGYSELRASYKAAKPAHQFLSKPCRFEDLVAAIERVIRLQRVLSDPGVRQTVSGIGALPALPDAYIRIQEELRKPEPSIQVLGDLVARDVGISATLLKLANSSFFGFFQNVTSPRRAVTLLGTETLKGLVLGAHLLAGLDLAQFAPFALERLWDHSLRTADIARRNAAVPQDLGKAVRKVLQLIECVAAMAAFVRDRVERDTAGPAMPVAAQRRRVEDGAGIAKNGALGRVGVVGGQRLVGEVAGGQHDRPADGGHQEVVERRGGQAGAAPAVAGIYEAGLDALKARFGA
jgi:DNA-binding NarL/FixJ family response regulator